MQTIPCGSLTVSRLAYGCWRIAGPGDSPEATPEREVSGRAAIVAAHEAGYTFFDLADIYADGMSEKIFGQTLKAVPGLRDRIVLATKCGIRKRSDGPPPAPYRYDFSAEYIRQSVEGSLRRLGVEMIDLLMLHRPDYLCDPAEVAGVFSALKQAGKVREFGVSNFRPSQFTLLQRACPMRLIVNQVEINLHKLDCLHDGTLDQCLTEKITPLAWSPLARGALSEVPPIDINSPDHARRIAVRETLEDIARHRGTTRPVVALAWLLKHPANIVPLVGSAKPERIREAARATEQTLTREEWYRLTEAAHGSRLP